MTTRSLGLIALASVTPPAMAEMRTPAIQGETLVFAYGGDLWVARKNSSSPARRLTSHPGIEIRPRISPDGRWVVFTGSYDREEQLYIVGIERGEPRRLTYGERAEAIGWTPDGRIAYRSSEGGWLPYPQRLWLIRPEGGLPEATPILEVADLSYLPGKNEVVYTRSFHQDFPETGKYGGGAMPRISFYDLKRNTYREMPTAGGSDNCPMVAGDSLYFTSDRKGDFLNLWQADLDGHNPRQVTKDKSHIRFPSTDGKSIAWERDGRIEVFDIAARTVTRQTPALPSDLESTKPVLKNLNGNIRSMAMNGLDSIVFEARGELFAAKPGDEKAANITNSSSTRERSPSFSRADGSLAYLADQTGNWEVYVLKAGDKTAKQMTKLAGQLPLNSVRWSPDGRHLELRTDVSELHLLDMATGQTKRIFSKLPASASVDWSPDSRWIAAVIKGANGLGAIHLYNTETAKTTQVTRGFYDDSLVAFDQNGRYLYVQSCRSFAPSAGRFEYSLKVDNSDRIYAVPLAADRLNPLWRGTEEGGKSELKGRIRIDLDGFEDRMVPLPIAPGRYPALIGGLDAVFYAALAGGSVALQKYDLTRKEATTHFSGGMTFLATSSDPEVAVVFDRSSISIIDTRPNAGEPRKLTIPKLEATIDPRAEWRQIFFDSWRYQRDNYHDPDMFGVDWEAMRDRYAPRLSSVAHRDDLNHLILAMYSELNTSHLRAMGGDMGEVPEPKAQGFLGADYEADHEHVRFKKIYRGENFDPARRGPLGEPGIVVQEGEYLLAIDGEPIDVNHAPGSRLVEKAPQFVVLTVNSKPTNEGAREVRVRTIASETELRYAAWVAANRAYVDEASGGQIGYFHVPNVNYEGAIEFIRGFYSQTDKRALIVDDRSNMGGNYQPWVEMLERQRTVVEQHRDVLPIPGDKAIDGPKALLINEWAASSGEVFAYQFRAAKLGVLIGRRTLGGTIGGRGATLVDGGVVVAPVQSLYDPRTGANIAENHGIEPDIDVDLRPDLLAQGKDAQLEAAVKHLLEELRKAGPPKSIPAIPARPGGSK